MNDETDKPEVSDEQRSLCRQWSKRLERALKQQKDDKKEEKYKRYRKYVRGDVDALRRCPVGHVVRRGKYAGWHADCGYSRCYPSACDFLRRLGIQDFPRE